VDFSPNYPTEAEISTYITASPSYPSNGKPYIRMYFYDYTEYYTDSPIQPRTMQYKISSINNTNSAIHCWNMARGISITSDVAESNSDYTISSPGDIAEVITVGAYISKDTLKTLSHGN
jgi:hypothetical protein